MNLKERAQALTGNSDIRKIGEVFIDDSTGNIIIISESGDRVLNGPEKQLVIRGNHTPTKKSILLD